MKKLICMLFALFLCVSLMANAPTASANDDPTPPTATEPAPEPTEPESTDAEGGAGIPATAEDVYVPYETL